MCPKIGKREKLCIILHIFLNVTRHVPLHKMRKNVCVNCCELQTELNLKNKKSELRNEKRLKRSSVFFYKETCPQQKKLLVRQCYLAVYCSIQQAYALKMKILLSYGTLLQFPISHIQQEMSTMLYTAVSKTRTVYYSNCCSILCMI